MEERDAQVNGTLARYLTAGEGPPLLLLHALGESARDWRWVLPALARNHAVYALDLPGISGGSGPPAGYSPASFASFVSGFLDAVSVGRAAVIGNSLGGQVALRLALSEPERVGSLCLVDSAGLGREVTYALRLPALPGYGELASGWSKTPAGAAQRALAKTGLLFARPYRAPSGWFEDQYRLARTSGSMQANVAALRAQVDAGGQREVLLDRLPDLNVPTLVVWGAQDRVFPLSHAHDAVARLKGGSPVLIPGSGHLPQVEKPDLFLAALEGFLNEAAF